MALILEATLDTLEEWSPLAPAQLRLRDEYLAFVRDLKVKALRREGGPEHLTGSCFVLTPDLSQVLLCFHRKVLGPAWFSPSGSPDLPVSFAGFDGYIDNHSH